MQVIFKSRDANADIELMRTAVIRRVKFAMRPLSWLAPRVSVQLADACGQHGGVDKQCQIEVTTSSGKPVVVTSFARDWLSALQSALARATRSLLHNLKRRPSSRIPKLKHASGS